MEPATTLAIIILIIAILILVYYYLQTTNNPVYQSIHSQASGITSKVAQEEYVTNFSEKVNDINTKIKDKIQTEEDKEHHSKTDIISKKIDQFIDEQSEQVINDWDLVTHKDLNQIIEKYDTLQEDLNTYKETNDNKVANLEERVNKIDEELTKMKN